MRSLLAKKIQPADAGERSGLFSSLEASLLRAAFSAGSPAATYRRLATFYAQRAMQVATIKSRLTMPAFVLISALFIQPLPGLVTGKLSVIAYLWQCLRPLVVLAGVAYLVMALPNWLRGNSSSLTPSWTDVQRLRIPLFGVMHLRRNFRDFVESLALMLEAGIPMLEALPKALETIDNSAIKQSFASVRPRVERGATLAEAISDLSYVPDNRIVEFIRTGETSGTLPEMLFRYAAMETDSIHQFYQQMTDWGPRFVYGLVVLWVAYGIVV